MLIECEEEESKDCEIFIKPMPVELDLGESEDCDLLQQAPSSPSDYLFYLRSPPCEPQPSFLDLPKPSILGVLAFSLYIGWLLFLGIVHWQRLANASTADASGANAMTMGNTLNLSNCTAHCAAQMQVCEETSCSVGLAAILKSCTLPDYQCQLNAYVRYGKGDNAFDAVLGCFRRHNCTFQMNDVNRLSQRNNSSSSSAHKNVTSVTSLQNISLGGSWWTVGVTNLIDKEQCGSQVFQYMKAFGKWIDNETMETVPCI